MSSQAIMGSGQSIDFLLIGDLAQATGASAKTIRFYEKEDLISPARKGRFRVYSRGDEQRLKAILELRAMGLDIHNIRLLTKQSTLDDLSDVTRSAYFQDLLKKHIEKLEQRRVEIERQIAAVESLLKSNIILKAAR